MWDKVLHATEVGYFIIIINNNFIYLFIFRM